MIFKKEKKRDTRSGSHKDDRQEGRRGGRRMIEHLTSMASTIRER